jgi:hypothetical protein
MRFRVANIAGLNERVQGQETTSSPMTTPAPAPSDHAGACIVAATPRTDSAPIRAFAANTDQAVKMHLAMAQKLGNSRKK